MKHLDDEHDRARWLAAQNQAAIEARDVPIVESRRGMLRCIPTWQDDVLPRFQRWHAVANWFNFPHEHDSTEFTEDSE